MSVHGEYNRALESLLADLRKIDDLLAKDWIEALEAARTGRNADLTAAAKHCLAVLDAIDARRALSARPGIGPDTDPLREPFLHLRAHCHAILGLSDPGEDAG